MGKNPFRGPLDHWIGGVGPKNEDFRALKWQRAKRVPFSAVSFSFEYRNIDAKMLLVRIQTSLIH
jgi:hypothetical protein